MKKTAILLALMTSFGIAEAQQTQPPASPMRPVQPVLPPPAAQSVPVQSPRPQLPPGEQSQAPNPSQDFRGTYLQTNAVHVQPRSPFAASNSAGAFLAGTNRIVPGMTNTIAGTNSQASSADRAITPADQQLLVRIRQQIRPLILAGRQWDSVRFVLSGGAVEVLGEVPDAQQKQQLLTIVQRTPGVMRVVDDLQINPQLNPVAVPGSTTEVSSSASTPSVPRIQSSSSDQTAIQDQAFTVPDQNLVTALRQAIQPAVGDSAPRTLVHFISRDGTVTVMGNVASDQQHQKVLALVQQTPGVVRVIDQLKVTSTGLANTQPGVPLLAPSNVPGVNLQPTGRITNSVTR